MKNYLSMLISLLCLGACTEKEADQLEFPFEGQFLVVEARLEVGASAEADLSKTIPVNGLQDFSVPNAKVFLLKNNQLFDTLINVREAREGFNFYQSQTGKIIPENGAYSILIEAPDFPSLKSATEEVIPPKIKILGVLPKFSTKGTFFCSGQMKFSNQEINSTDQLLQILLVVTGTKMRNANKPNEIIKDTTIVRGDFVRKEDYFFSPDTTTIVWQDYPFFELDRNKIKKVVVKIRRLNQAFKDYHTDQVAHYRFIGGFFPTTPFLRSNLKDGYGVLATMSVDSAKIWP